MNYGQNLTLINLATYTSPLGGSKNPITTPFGHLLFEVILEGSVYGLEEEPKLHSPGSTFCHAPGQKTVSNSPPQSYYQCLVILFQCHKDGAKIPPWPRNFQWKDWQSMHRFADEMLYAFHQSPLNRTVIGNLIWSRLRFELEQSRLQERLQAVHPHLRLATDFINAHYKSPISLGDIAQAAGISVPHLHMLFRDHLKESPHQYLIQKRMRVACHALAATDAPIKAIAAEVGYANIENFCRAFKKYASRSASEYRQAYA